MKKSVLCLCSTIALCVGGVVPAFADNIAACRVSACSDSAFPTVSNTLLTPSQCATYTDTCYTGGTRVRTCTSCNTGYKLTSSKTYIVTCDQGTWTTSYQDCSSSGTGGGGGGDIVVGPVLTFCVVGQYYSSLDSKCVDCPSPGTSASGATAITDCYIPKNTTFSDETGSGVYTDDCHYSTKNDFVIVGPLL